MKRALLALTVCVYPWLSGLAQDPQAPPAPMAVAQFLGFSETQAARFQELLQGMQAAIGGLERQMGARQQQLERLLSDDKTDPASVVGLLVQIRALQRQTGQAYQAYHENFLALLTPEQQEKARAVVQAGQLAPAVRAFAEVRLIEPPH